MGRSETQSESPSVTFLLESSNDDLTHTLEVGNITSYLRAPTAHIPSSCKVFPICQNRKGAKEKWAEHVIPKNATRALSEVTTAPPRFSLAMISSVKALTYHSPNNPHSMPFLGVNSSSYTRVM